MIKVINMKSYNHKKINYKNQNEKKKKVMNRLDL